MPGSNPREHVDLESGSDWMKVEKSACSECDKCFCKLVLEFARFCIGVCVSPLILGLALFIEMIDYCF